MLLSPVKPTSQFGSIDFIVVILMMSLGYVCRLVGLDSFGLSLSHLTPSPVARLCVGNVFFTSVSQVR